MMPILVNAIGHSTKDSPALSSVGKKPIAAYQIPEVMSSPLTLSQGASFIASRLQFGDDLVLQHVFQEPP